MIDVRATADFGIINSMYFVLERRFFVTFLGAFVKLRKVTISFVMSVCLPVRMSDRMEQLGSHCTDFHEV